jgi:hypothetical protein
MKLRLIFLSLLALCLTVTPAVAQNDLYDNGPTDGNTDAWTVSSGFVVSDSFHLESEAFPTGLRFATWMLEGDVLQTADISITSEEFGGTTFFSGTVAFAQSDCVTNGFGFNICTESGSFFGPVLNAGAYWLNMQNAVASDGDPVYWDENRGPSSASENSLGTIPSESFSLVAGSGGTTSTTNGTSDSMPEPSSILLFGSGLLGVAGVMRRKL